MPELDGVRGLAIALVMALHFAYLREPHGVLAQLISKLAGYGLWGVELFFVLSGFLITGILFDGKGRSGYFKNFYMRRTLRIFPLYYGVLFVLLVLLPDALLLWFDPELLETRRLGAWLWPYLSNVHVAETGRFSIPYVSHFWSLAVEEHFYLFWPFLIAFLSRHSAMRACLALAGLALALRLALWFSGASPLAAQVLTPCRLDTLCLGAYFALAVRGQEGNAPWLLRARAWFVPAAIVTTALHGLQRVVPALEIPIVALRDTALSLTFALMILSVSDPAGSGTLRRLFQLGWLRTLGKYSYGLYVFHGIVAYAFERKELQASLEGALGSQLVSLTVLIGIGTGLSMALAVASYELFEIKFLRLKALFVPDGEERVARAGVGESPGPELLGRGSG